jgi:uncharacterized membrane protein YadS
MVAVASLSARRKLEKGASRPPIVPLFIVGFVAAVLVRTVLPIPDAALAIADTLQSVVLAAALFAIGASLRLERLIRSGPRALAAAALSWLVILALALLLVRLT